MEPLPWIRFDTSFPTHDKVLDLLEASGKSKIAAKSAGFVYACSLAHCGAQGTDGLVKRAALPFVHGTSAEAKMLVSVGLWDVDPQGWRIRGWGTRQVVGAAQQVISEERSKAGKKGAEKRWAS